MARASIRSGPTCAPRPGCRVDPRVLNYVDVDATVDILFPSDCSNYGCSSRSGDIYGDCSDDCMFSKTFGSCTSCGIATFCISIHVLK